MKSKILNLGLILTSLAGYMEWGGGNRMSLFQAEAEIFSKIFTDFSSVAHPLVLLPLIGQIFLIFTLFQKKNRQGAYFFGDGRDWHFVGNHVGGWHHHLKFENDSFHIAILYNRLDHYTSSFNKQGNSGQDRPHLGQVHNGNKNKI